MIRLAAHVGGVEYEDCTIKGAQYGELKARLCDKARVLNLPCLEVGDECFTESNAILTYIATLGKLQPTDPLMAARSNEMVNLMSDMFPAFAHTFGIADAAEQLASREALFKGPDGKLNKFFTKLDAYFAKMTTKYICGDELCTADICVYGNIHVPVCGMVEGIPLDSLTAFPNVMAYRERVGTHPKVASRYASATEGLFMAYQVK